MSKRRNHWAKFDDPGKQLIYDKFRKNPLLRATPKLQSAVRCGMKNINRPPEDWTIYPAWLAGFHIALYDRDKKKLMRIRHHKRQSTYRVIGSGELQVSIADIGDGSELTIYQCEKTGKIYLRAPEEFTTERFGFIS